MALRTFHVLLTCLLCLLRTGNGQTIDGPTQITVTPTTLTLTPSASDTTGGQVTIQCRASSLGQGEDLLAMNIQRVLHNSPDADPIVVVGATSSKDQGNAALVLQSLQGATVTGSVGENSITLTMSRAQCADAGIYYCTATALGSTFDTKYYESFTNVTIEVSPGSITMTTEPSGVNNWRVKDTLLMRCNGIVGTVQDDSQVEWIWEFQDGNRFSGVENWQPYSDIGDSSADIQTNSLPTTNSCYKRQISVLTRHLTLDDTDREYRCYVINNGLSGSQNAQANAQVISVGTVSESDVAPATPTISSGSVIQTTQRVAMPMRTTTVTVTACPPQTSKVKDDRQQTCKCPDVGVIIAAVVAALIVIDVVILTVVIIFLKRRIKGSAAQTFKEDTRGNESQMSSVGNVSRPVEQRPVEQRPVEQRPVEQLPFEQRPIEQRPVEQRPVEQRPVEQRPVEQDSVSTAENPNPYDGLIMKDVGVASLYQDLSSPYELPQ